MEYDDIIEEALIDNKNRIEGIIKEWCNEAGVVTPVGYYRNSLNGVVEIYSKQVGYLIGYKGRLVEKYKEIINKEFDGDCSISFVEVKGGFVCFDK